MITDNASHDETGSQVNRFPDITFNKNQHNLGFAAAHNQGLRSFLDSDSEIFLVVNPDVALPPDFLTRLEKTLAGNPECGMITPKLLRADSQLRPGTPAFLDAAGMYLTKDLRHFDRGSNEPDRGQYNEKEFVFGGTGACLIFKREEIQKLLLPRISDDVLFKIYPELESGASDRPQLFDEAFFAYREDADLSWRAAQLGVQCLYDPNLVAYHERVVLPERRAMLEPEINSMSVRNRFLLQVNNFAFAMGVVTFFRGIIIRNLIVIAGVLVKERYSLKGLREFLTLFPRALKIRRFLKTKRMLSGD